MTTDLASRVDAGARLLDEKRPGWHLEIAMDRLAMESCKDCILWQLYGHYHEGKWEINTIDGISLGFCESDYPVENEWGILADLWRAEIRKRLEAGS